MNKRNVIATTLSISINIVCVALVFWGHLKNNGTITTDAFIGILATFIGVCATIVVGFQIAGFLELREVKKQVEQVEKQRSELENYKKTIENDIYIAKAGVSNAFGILSVVEKGTLLGFAARVSSIVCDKIDATPGNVLLIRYQQLYTETQSFLQTNDYIDLMCPIIDSLNYVNIPKEKDFYNEIMKLHYEIIYMIDEAKRRFENKS